MKNSLQPYRTRGRTNIARSLPKRIEIPKEESTFSEQDLSSQAIMFYTFDDVVENFNSIGPRKNMMHGQADPILALKSCFNFKNDKICVGPQKKITKRLKSKPKITDNWPKVKKEDLIDLPKPSTRAVSSKFQKNGSEESKTTSSTIMKKESNQYPNQYNRLAKKTTFTSITQNDINCSLQLKEPENVNKNFKVKNLSSGINTPQCGIKRRRRNTNAPPKFCFSCNWSFPHELTIYDINSHINLCIDGIGEQSKAELLSEISLNNNKQASKVSTLKTNEISYPICKRYKRRSKVISKST